MKYLYTSIIIFILSINLNAQEYVESTFLETIDKSFFFDEFGLFVTNGVELYRMNYTTTGSDGQLDTASGLVVIPDVKDITYNTVVYHHGTVGSRYEVPGYGSAERVVPAIYSAFGFVALAPDYIGLGDSRGFHPYVHAETEAIATKDMALAVKAFLDEKEIQTDNTIMMSGYSQGGHAGMAAHRLFESTDFGYEVVAAAHMSGPYDISTAMKELLLSDEEYPLVSYAAFVALGYNEVYNIFDGDINNFFLPQYSSLILRFYEEEITLWELNDLLINQLNQDFGKASPKLMILPEKLDSINSIPDYRLNMLLRENDVYDWAPQANTLLIYCGADEQVAPQNTVTAERVMKENGAPAVTAILSDPNGTHSTCFTPAITASLFHFIGNRRTTSNTEENEIDVQIYPNPTSAILTIKTPFSITAVNIFGMDGSIMQFNAMGDNDLDISSLPVGAYIVNIALQDGRNVIRKVIKQ